METKEKQRLVKQAMKGSPDAYGKLIDMCREYLYKTAYLYVRNEESALDIVGTTVLKAYQNIHSLKAPEYFQTWLTKILINCAKDELKRISRYKSIEETQAPYSGTGLSIEEKCDVRTAVSRLPEKYGMIIILKYFNEFSVKEIAFVLEIPEGSVKAYLTRARAELKKILKEDYQYAD